MTVTSTAVHKDEQQSVIRFLMQENVLVSEIHAIIRMVHGVQNVTSQQQ